MSLNQKHITTKNTDRYSKKFKDLLSEKLSKKDFENLPTLLGVSSHRKTKILNNPQDCPMELIESFANLLGVEAYDLVMTYRLGYSTVNMELVDQYYQAKKETSDKAA